ncbi:protoglobin domain-containing protein [Gloeobacter morelensis]|uniref:Protogloblin ApPgb n=1 Tax=Gloeobacter morelensis MG652769 TaxID=2781736 RepID=A0ABY3PS43_9CYAN|nr:protoglobin domain-containing protein [Gloeobacter morelensis]UFP96510.1 protogloblin ApPgb [Gloeobacter morelensis MG652769]
MSDLTQGSTAFRSHDDLGEARRTVPGYRLGDPALPPSPVTLEELELLKKTLLLTEEDVRYLRMAGAVMQPQIEAILDVWYGFVGAHPHLIRYFSNKADGTPNADYLARVRARFGQWIVDTTNADYDQAWLDYQHEIGLRHTRAAKNRTDDAPSVDQVNFRYLIAFIVPISATVEPFLAQGQHSPDDVRKMHAAWTKSVVLQTILWSYPYVRDGEF